MLDRECERYAVLKIVRQRLRQAEHHVQAGSRKLVLHRGEAVLDDAPLGGERGGVPGVVDVPERKQLGWGERLVDAEQLLAPVGGRRHGCNIAVGQGRGIGRVAAGLRVWQRDDVGAENRLRQVVDVDMPPGWCAVGNRPMNRAVWIPGSAGSGSEYGHTSLKSPERSATVGTAWL